VTDDPKVIAFYLPQFHPIPENDAWWGAGFTEWSNVVKAKPLFEGHYQPHLPGDLGFYDLRIPEVREHQAALARAHGIDAFCYYHYWFAGRRVLDRVFEEVLRTGKPDFPFSLCWANENWTRAWDASEKEVLLKQDYGVAEREAHIRFLVDAFLDPRYVRIEGRPLFSFYRIQALPDAGTFVDRLREVSIARGAGDPYLIKFDTHGLADDPAIHHCDAAAQFIPHGAHEVLEARDIPDLTPGNLVYDYDELKGAFLDFDDPGWIRHRCVIPGWDNTSRRGDGRSFLITDNTPESYEDWLRQARQRAGGSSGVVFVNAWNEWAEGAHLEPDERDGTAYLRATARAVLGHEPEHVVLPSNGSPERVWTGPRFSDLYVDLYERCVQMQRRLTATESALQMHLEGRVGNDLATQNARLVVELRIQIGFLEQQLREAWAELGRH
jgi:hypothetical protein